MTEKKSLLLKKLSCYLDDMMLFLPREREQAAAMVDEQVKKGKRSFTITELSIFENVADSLKVEGDLELEDI